MLRVYRIVGRGSPSGPDSAVPSAQPHAPGWRTHGSVEPAARPCYATAIDLRIPKLPSELGPTEAALVRKAGRAQALVALHDWVAAAAELKELAAAFGSEPGVLYMQSVFLLKEHPADALAEFDKEVQISPKEPDARLQITLECLRSGDYDRARKNAAEAVALAPPVFRRAPGFGAPMARAGKRGQGLAGGENRRQARRRQS